MPVETLTRPEYSPIEPQAESLHVFDVSLYRNLFNQATQSGLPKEEARNVVAFSATHDSLGAVTENISGEKDDLGNYYFDVESRIRMQMTPPRHFYFQEEDEVTHESIMVAPEHKWGNFRKDVLSLISNWRRGMDKVGMAGIRAKFLDKSERALKEGETIIWGSPKAEKWEEGAVRRYNGEYGFLYVGKVTTVDGVRALEVYDFKNDFDASGYDAIFQSMEGEVSTNPACLDHPLVDKVKASYVVTNQNWTIATIWRKLGEIQEKICGKAEIFNLPISAVVALQDPSLHERISEEIATPVGEWIANEIYKGTSSDEIQNQVRQKFIYMTLSLLKRIKAERLLRERLGGEQASLSSTFFVTQDQRYTDNIDPAILLRYSGSGGAGCGTWGRSHKGGFRASSVLGLSSAFGGSESIGGACNECGGGIGDDHYHCDGCGKKYASERNSTSRTPQCSCGRKFSC